MTTPHPLTEPLPDAGTLAAAASDAGAADDWAQSFADTIMLRGFDYDRERSTSDGPAGNRLAFVKPAAGVDAAAAWRHILGVAADSRNDSDPLERRDLIAKLVGAWFADAAWKPLRDPWAGNTDLVDVAASKPSGGAVNADVAIKTAAAADADDGAGEKAAA